jgi:phospholipid/cholesterol/gamma-HCH transport system substrate-binding protein
MDRLKKDSLLGLVFLGTLAFLLWATINLTDLSVGNVRLEVLFADAGGIRVGDAVQLLGMKIGKVTDVRFDADRAKNPMHVLLRVDNQPPLRDDYRIEIQADGLLGGKMVYIAPGTGGPLPAGTELVGRSAGNMLDKAGSFFEGSGPTGVKLQNALEQIGQFFGHLNDPQTSIGAVTNSRELYEEILGAVQSLRRSLLTIERSEGMAGRLINDRVVGDDFARFIANLRLVSERLTGTDTTVGKLFNDQQLGAVVQKMLEDIGAMVSDTKDGKGLLGAALRDPQVEGDFKNLVAMADALMQKLNDPEAGLAGRLFADPEQSRLIRQVVADVAHVTHQLADGKGVFGVLINDEDLGMRLRRIFHQVSRAIEDAREAAPIATFVQVLIGVF